MIVSQYTDSSTGSHPACSPGIDGPDQVARLATAGACFSLRIESIPLLIHVQPLEHRLAEMKEPEVGQLFLDVLAGGRLQADLDLVDEGPGPFLAGALEELTERPGRERPAQGGRDLLRHLGGRLVGMGHPELQDRVVGLPGALLEALKRVPGPVQQIVSARPR